MYRKLIVTCVVSVVFSLLAPSTAQACSCRDVIYPKLSQKKLARLVVKIALRESDTVFSGQVIQITPKTVSNWEKEAQVRFKVAESWKGKVGEEATVTTSVGCCGCGYSFKVGERYLVYAYRADDGLVTDACTRTATSAQAKRDLKILAKGKGAVNGGVTFLRRKA